MAQSYYEGEYNSFDDDGAPVVSLINWIGAILSFALIIGLVVWGYQLLVRDVSGVPVVRALEGPMRVAPENPGGVQAAYQDLTVTRVAADGAEEAPAERVVLAPPPVALSEEDQPVAALIPDTPSAPAEAAEEPRSAIELAIAEALGEEAETVSPVYSEDRITPPSTLRPRARPAQIVPAAADDQAGVQIQNAVAVAATSPANDTDITDIPPGTRLVQLGAYPTVGGAREAWAALDAKFGDYLSGKRRVVQEATAGGTTFYRLRAMGFQDLNDARRFCAVLVAENANCIPVIRR